MEVYVKVAFNRYYFFVTKTIFKRQADFATNPQQIFATNLFQRISQSPG